METLRIVGLVVGGIILLGALATMGVWVPKVLYRSPEPGKLDGLTVKFTDARVSEDRVIDRTQSPAAIVAALNGLEAQAKLRGSALGAGFSYPVTVEAAARWTAGLEQRGLQLAPASSMSRRPGR